MQTCSIFGIDLEVALRGFKIDLAEALLMHEDEAIEQVMLDPDEVEDEEQDAFYDLTLTLTLIGGGA